jgi:hypothetical protein
MKLVKSARENIPLARRVSQKQITASWSWNCEMGESRFGANTSKKDRAHSGGFSTRRINAGGGQSKIIRSQNGVQFASQQGEQEDLKRKTDQRNGS